MKLRAKFIFLFLIISMMPMVFYGMVVFNQMSTHQKRLNKNHLSVIASLKEVEILNVIEQNYERIRGVTSRTQLRLSLREYQQQPDPDPAIMNKIERIMANARDGIEDFKEIFIVDFEGQIIASTESNSKYRSLINDWIVDQGAKKETISIEVDESGNQLIVLAAPLILDNETLGIVVVCASAASIERISSDYSLMGKTGDIVIAKRNRDGHAEFIASRRFEENQAAQKNIAIDQIDVPIIQALLKKENMFFDSVDYRGVPVISTTRYIEPVDWGLAIKIDKIEARQLLTEAKNTTIIIGGILFVFILIFAFVISKTISDPIQNLAETASAIAKGDLDAKFDKEVKLIDDEVGELAQSISLMAGNLIKANTELDKKVKDRTVELEKRLAELDRFNQVMVGRELKMKELKTEIAKLKKE